MKIKINGKEGVFPQAQLSVEELLKASKVEQPEMVSVQVNGAFVKAADFKTTYLKEGDEVDFLYFMGGGAGSVA